jgi:hypothetical protein
MKNILMTAAELRPFSLQMFAEESVEPAAASEPAADPASEISFTEEQIAKVNQIIESRLAKESKRLAKQAEKKANEKAAADRLAQLSEEERRNEEFNSMKAQLDALQAERQQSQMMSAARKELQTRGFSFSDAIVARLIGDSAETTKESIDAFTQEFEKAVQAYVKKNSPSTAPKAGAPASITKEQIMQVKNKAERQKLIAQNMHLFRK